MKSKAKKSSNSTKATLTSLPGLKFLNEVDTELRKVTWPDRKQVTRMSAIVIVASLLFGLYLGALDLGFTTLMSYIFQLGN